MRKKKVKETLYVASDSVETRQKKSILIQSSLSQCHKKLHQVVGLTTLEICYGAGFALTPLLLKAHFCFTTLLKQLLKEAPNKNILLLSCNSSICNALGIKHAVIT